MRMSVKLPDGLKTAVKEYYEWNGDKNGHAVKIIESQPGEFGVRAQMALCRFTDGKGSKGSSLLTFSGWADGHYDVTEIYVVCREHEKELVEAFESSTGMLEEEEEWYDDDDC